MEVLTIALIVYSDSLWSCFEPRRGPAHTGTTLTIGIANELYADWSRWRKWLSMISGRTSWRLRGGGNESPKSGQYAVLRFIPVYQVVASTYLDTGEARLVP